MNDLERIEEHRDLVAGLEYEDWSERVSVEEEQDDDEPSEELEENVEVAA